MRSRWRGIWIVEETERGYRKIAISWDWRVRGWVIDVTLGKRWPPITIYRHWTHPKRVRERAKLLGPHS